MSTWLEHAITVTRYDLRLTEVYVSSSTARPLNTTSGVKLRIGIAGETGTDWVGTWDQAKSSLSVNESVTFLTKQVPVSYGDIIVIEVTQNGAESLAGLSASVSLSATNLSGGPLLYAVDGIEDERTREVLSAVIRQIGAASSNEHTYTVRFTDRG